MNVSPARMLEPNTRRTLQKSRQGGRAGRAGAEGLERESGGRPPAGTSRDAERARSGMGSPIAMPQAYAGIPVMPDSWRDEPRPADSCLKLLPPASVAGEDGLLAHPLSHLVDHRHRAHSDFDRFAIWRPLEE